MNLLIINQPLNNRGDESAHRGLVRKLSKKYPNSEITVFFIGANNNSISQFTVQLPNVQYVNIKPIRLWSKVAKYAMLFNMPYIFYIHPTICKIMYAMKKSEYVICAPGGICMGGFKDWTHVSLLYIAKYLKRKIVYFGRSIGPFTEETRELKRFKKASISILKSVHYLSLRDIKSQLLADELNIRYCKTLDSAFLDNVEYNIPLDLERKLTDQYIVVVPNLLIWHYAYKDVPKNVILDFYIKLLSGILHKYPGYQIIMLPQTFNYDTYLGDDIHFFNELKFAMNDNRVVVINDCYGSDIQQSIISKCEFLVGARYHSIVFALNNKVPFVALSYEHKIAGLLESLGKEESMLDITDIFSDAVRIDVFYKQFMLKLGNLTIDNNACNEAKAIANNAFSDLDSYLRK